VQHLDDVAVGGDDRGEPVDDGDVALDLYALALGGGTSVGVGGQPSLGLLETTFEQRPPFVEPGVADLEVLAARRQRRGARLVLGPQFTPGASRVGFGLLVGLERGKQRLELTDALVVAGDVRGEIGDRTLEVGQLRRRLTVLALGSGQPSEAVVNVASFASRRRVSSASAARAAWTASSDVATASTARASVASAPAACSMASSSAAAVRAGAGRPDAPSAEPEPVASFGDDDDIGMGEGGVDGRSDVVDANRGTEQAVEQCVDAGPVGSGVGTHGVAECRR
jgi:hypothetical protein